MLGAEGGLRRLSQLAELAGVNWPSQLAGSTGRVNWLSRLAELTG